MLELHYILGYSGRNAKWTWATSNGSPYLGCRPYEKDEIQSSTSVIFLDMNALFYKKVLVNTLPLHWSDSFLN